jgi:uncharacterized UBP type Zn finger protein
VSGGLVRWANAPLTADAAVGADLLLSPVFGESSQGGHMQVACTHLDQIRKVTPHTPQGCEECLKIGSRWVHLRLCLECGHVGCCDSSLHKHATKHFHHTGHPIMQSFEPGESWAWCYIDAVELELPARRG